MDVCTFCDECCCERVCTGLCGSLPAVPLGVHPGLGWQVTQQLCVDSEDLETGFHSSRAILHSHRQRTNFSFSTSSPMLVIFFKNDILYMNPCTGLTIQSLCIYTDLIKTPSGAPPFRCVGTEHAFIYTHVHPWLHNENASFRTTPAGLPRWLSPQESAC